MIIVMICYAGGKKKFSTKQFALSLESSLVNFMDTHHRAAFYGDEDRAHLCM